MEPSIGESIFRHAGLLAALAWCGNGVVWWVRGVRRHPDRRRGYVRLVSGFMAFGSIPWLFLELLVVTGTLSSPTDLAGAPTTSLAVLAFQVTTLAVIFLGTFWIFFRDGAQKLVDHPGLLNFDLTSTRQLKFLWVAFFSVGIVAWVVQWLAA